MVTQLHSQGLASRGRVRWPSHQEDERSRIEAGFTAWLDDITAVQDIFSKHVYNNPECSDFDLRQHRVLLYKLLAVGEELVVDALACHQEQPILESYIKLGDQKLEELRTVLHEWHGPVEDTSLPESLKSAFKELQAGSLTDLEFPR